MQAGSRALVAALLAALASATLTSARATAEPEARATAEPEALLPGPLVDLRARSGVAASLIVPVGDRYLAAVPAVRLQLGRRGLAVGVELGLAAIDTDDPALTGYAEPTGSGVHPASVVVDGCARRCRADGAVCGGLVLTTGLATVSPASAGARGGLFAGTIAHVGRLSRFVERGLAVEALPAVALLGRRASAQLAVGPALLFTRDDVDERRFQAHLLWEAAAAGWLRRDLALSLAVHGARDLRPRLAEWPIKDVARALVAVSLTAHLRRGRWRPLVRVTLPIAGYGELVAASVSVAAVVNSR